MELYEHLLRHIGDIGRQTMVVHDTRAKFFTELFETMKWKVINPTWDLNGFRVEDPKGNTVKFNIGVIYNPGNDPTRIVKIVFHEDHFGNTDYIQNNLNMIHDMRDALRKLRVKYEMCNINETRGVHRIRIEIKACNLPFKTRGKKALGL